MQAGQVEAGTACMDEGATGRPTYPARTTPQQAIEKLCLAYEAPNLFHYMDCLSDTFRFWLHPEDLYSHPEWPASWVYGNELALHSNMFGPIGQVNSISLCLVEVRAPQEIASQPPGGPSSWLLAYNYSLRIDTDGVWDYIAEGGAQLKLSVDPTGTGPGGEPLWEVASWSDVESIQSAVEETSWGAIKSLYR